MSVPAADPALVEKVVTANHILYDHGVVDGFGHVSTRHDKDPERFLLSRNRAPALVAREDIVTYDLEGEAVDAAGRPSYLERFIHAAIYRVRPDVKAVVHSHSPNVIPFGATAQPLKPIFHMSGFLGHGSAHFEIREAGGNTDMLIRSMELGHALARSLGANAAVLMRGHGITVVGTSIEQVVYRSIYAEVNARLQAQATGLGDVTYLNEEEAALAAATNDGQIPRTWELWRQRVAHKT